MSNKYKVPTNWQFKPFKTRCIKFQLSSHDELEKIKSNHIKAFNKISISFCKEFPSIKTTRTINSNEIKIIEEQKKNKIIKYVVLLSNNKKLGTFKFEKNNITTYTVAWESIYGEIQKKYKQILEKYNLYNSKLQEAVVFDLGGRYRGYKGRFKKYPIKPILLKESKSTFIKYGEFIKDKYQKNTFTITASGVKNGKNYDKIIIPYKIVFGHQYLSLLIKKKKNKKTNQEKLVPFKGGGYLSNRRKKWIFTVQVKSNFKWLYSPLTYLGLDFNKTHKDFITESDGTRTAHTIEIIKLCAEINRLNKLIPLGNKSDILINSGININTGYRSKLRKNVIKLHNKLRIETQEIAQNLINYAKTNKMLLCIDGVAVGNCTFAQEHLRKNLVQKCENQCVPFVIVNPAYTSRRCSNCKHINSKKARNRKKEQLVCEKCNFKLDDQINGAINVGEIGWKEWINS